MEKELLVKQILGEDAKILTPLYGGMMNESYIVSADGKKYVLYIATAQANEMVNRPLERDNQQIIYSLGITSKNVYFDTDTGIKINEYIEGKSLDHLESYDAKKVANLLKTMHNSPTLSKENYHPFPRFIAYEQEAETFNIIRSEDYRVLRNRLFTDRDFLESQPLVLCHNDAQKSNIVRSDKDEYFLIDFEFMMNNDRIYDIAAFGNGLVSEGRELLDFYFDGKPTKEEIKRYYLWRIFLSLQWHNVAIVKHYRGEGKTHNYNFLDVAEFFLNNAKEAYQRLIEE